MPADVAATLGSPALARLIAEAYRTSPALLAGDERVRQARGLARSARAAGMPVVGAAGGAGRNHSALDFGTTFGGLDVAISPDFGGERSARRRAENARADAAVQDQEGLRRRAAAEIARSYVQRAALARRLALVDEGIVQARSVERIVAERVREGEASRVELAFQAIRTHRLSAERVRLAGALEQSRVALALLIGQEAPMFVAEPGDLAALTPRAVPLRAPVAIIDAQPQVSAAAARLRAAGGDVAVAKAAFVPRLALSAGAIAGAAVTGGLNLGASLLAPIFNRGELRGALETVSARQREAALLYRQAVLAALGDVEGALNAMAVAQARGTVLVKLQQEARIAGELSRRRYLEGEAGLQEVLDAQDLLIAARDGEALGQEEALDAAILLWLAAG